MTNPNDGKFETKTQICGESRKQGNFIASRDHSKAMTVLLALSLTIFMAYKEQFLYSLFAAALTLAAATSERLRKIRVGLQGIQSEWGDARNPKPHPKG